MGSALRSRFFHCINMATNSRRYNKEGCFALLERPFYAACLPCNLETSF